ncbi:hypothetical protein LINGRAHAP2_LOCUS28503 [Linum grandiflorum]
MGQPLSICNRIYSFIMKSLATQAFKTVTLGCSTAPPTHHDGTRADFDEGKSDASVVKPEEEKGPAKKTTSSSLASLLASEARGPPKKVVSINERVEEIDKSKKMMIRRKGSSEKVNPFEGQAGDDIDKPLRSILKVGSMSRD